MLDLGLTPAKPTATSFLDITPQNFESAVLLASQSKPVIVQFWAPWCGPCRQLKPALEKVVGDAKGAVGMVRVNIDDNPELAQALRVQSVPMVYAFYQGQPVDGFVGVRPESELKAFVAKLAALTGAVANDSAVDAVAVKKTLDQAAQFFADGQLTEAMAAYSTAYDMDPDNAAALAGIAWCFVAEKNLEAFAAVTEELSEELQKAKELAGLLQVKAWCSDGVDLDVAALTAQVTAAPQEHAARFDLAQAQLATLEIETAIDNLLTIIRKQRDWENGRAREKLVAVLDALGPLHPMTKPARRQLSAVLFS